MIKQITVQGGYSSGGYSFDVLDTPSSQTYIIENVKKFQLGDDTYWHGYLKGAEVKNKKFPIDANPRKPGPTKVVKLMQATIQKEPFNFHHLNNGITIIAETVALDEQTKTLTIDFGEITGNHGDGICNGGHSYFAIDQFQGSISDEMLVRIEIIELGGNLEKSQRASKIKAIAEARNAHNELESITTAHYSGYYDKIIEKLGSDSSLFKWYEGDPNAIKNAEKVDTLIAKLTAVSPHWYSHYLNKSGNTGTHLSSARNQGSTHSKWLEIALNDLDDRNLHYLLPLLKDILLLKDEISYSLFHDDFPQVKTRWRSSRIWQYLSEKNEVDLLFKKSNGDTQQGYALSHAFATMILGAFRENVWFSLNDSGINFVGWLVEPIKLWHEHKQSFMKDLDNIASSINAPSFGNAFLQNPAIYNYQFTRYEFGTRLKSSISKPEIIYDISNSNKYITCALPEGEKYLRTNIIEEGIPPICELLDSSSPTFPNYKNINE